MPEFDVFPDSEQLAHGILVAADWSPLTLPRIGSGIPDDPDWDTGIVQLQRTGGLIAERHRVDRPSIQFDCWASTKKLAHDIAVKARQLMMQSEGQSYVLEDGSQAFLSGVDDGVTLAWIFDSISLKPRYTFSVYLTVHALP